MEHYYFIQKGNRKQGPFKLEQLKQQIIYFDELIWRSDSDVWKKASDYEELSQIFIIKPPPTPKEQRITEVNQRFKSEIIGILTFSYIVISILISIISCVVAQTSWEKYLKDTDGKYLGNNKSGSPGYVTLYELNANKRYPMYTPNYNNESAYGYGQSFWFRPFRAFGSTIYLTNEEQSDSSSLFFNLMLSSFASLSFIFIGFAIVYYGIKRNSPNEQPDIESNNDIERKAKLHDESTKRETLTNKIKESESNLKVITSKVETKAPQSETEKDLKVFLLSLFIASLGFVLLHEFLVHFKVIQSFW